MNTTTNMSTNHHVSPAVTERPTNLVVGSVAYDDLDLPSGEFRDVVGGAATYSAIAASIYSPVRLVGVVGDDFGEVPISILKKRKIDLRGLEHAPGKTFRWHGEYAADLSSRKTLRTDLNVFAEFHPKIPEDYRSSKYLLLGNIHPALQLEVLRRVERPRFVAADTMNFWISGERALLGEVLKSVDLLMINDEEARELSGVHSLKKAAAVIRAMGPKYLIIKRGEYGAMLFDDDGAFFVPGYPLENVVDPTGAGDSFAGGLFGYLSAVDDGGTGPLPKRTLRRAMVVASSVASFCVEGVGTSSVANLNAVTVRDRINDFLSMLSLGEMVFPAGAI